MSSGTSGVQASLRGHPIYCDADGVWRYVDTGDRTDETWRERPCGHCGLHFTAEGHDGCLGTLRGVMNACCGHGDPSTAYVKYADGSRVAGAAALAEMERAP